MPCVRLLVVLLSSATCGEANRVGDDSITLLHLAAPVVDSDIGACRGLPEHTPRFEEFVKKYNRSFSGEAEYQQRLALYQASVQRILKQNCRTDSWTATVNHFSDRSHEELSRLHGWRGAAKAQSAGGAAPPLSLLQTDRNWHLDYRSLRRGFEHYNPHHDGNYEDSVNHDVNKEFRHEESHTPEGAIAKSRDWRGLSSTTTPMHQGECGSCWAFATTTVLGAHSELYGEKRTFSPQHLIQCVANPRKCGGSGGCDGATVELALEHVLQHGLATNEDLPYTGREVKCFDGPTPRVAGHKSRTPSTSHQVNEAIKTIASLLEKQHDVTELNQSESERSLAAKTEKTEVKAKVVQGFTGWKNPLHNNYHALVRALQDGPVAVAVQAMDSWYSYGGGIAGDDCNPGANINHAVALVGYGTRGSLKYWLIQNSWGPGWGVNGFMRLMSRGQAEDAYCGWDTQPRVGSGCEDGPSRVWVCGTCGILYDPVQPVFSK